jgi:hypothetical protein
MATKKEKPAQPMTALEVHKIIDEAVNKIRTSDATFSMLIGALRCATLTAEQDYLAAQQRMRSAQ